MNAPARFRTVQIRRDADRIESPARWGSAGAGPTGSAEMCRRPSRTFVAPCAKVSAAARAASAETASTIEPSEDGGRALLRRASSITPCCGSPAQESRSPDGRPAASRGGQRDRRLQVGEQRQSLSRPLPPATTSQAFPHLVAVSSPLKSPGPLKTPSWPAIGHRPGMRNGRRPRVGGVEQHGCIERPAVQVVLDVDAGEERAARRALPDTGG